MCGNVVNPVITESSEQTRRVLYLMYCSVCTQCFFVLLYTPSHSKCRHFSTCVYAVDDVFVKPPLAVTLATANAKHIHIGSRSSTPNILFAWCVAMCVCVEPSNTNLTVCVVLSIACDKVPCGCMDAIRHEPQYSCAIAGRVCILNALCARGRGNIQVTTRICH